jgi:hypothetical protein
MHTAPDTPPEQEIIPPGQPDHFRSQWQHRAQQQFRHMPFLLRLPAWALIAIPLAMLLLWGVHMYAAHTLFAYYSSGFIGFLAVVLCLALRATPLLLVGSCMAAYQLWEWGLPLALVFAASGVLLMPLRMLKAWHMFKKIMR